MSESAITVREVFDLPQPGSPEESSPRWQTLREWMGQEVKGIKSAAMPDIAAKIAELLEVPIPTIFLTSWKKSDAIRKLLDESRGTPDAKMHLELAEHTINSQHRPHIEIRIQNTTVKTIEFTLRLQFKLKGFILRIQNGSIKDMQTGTCEVKGTLEYQGLAVVEKKLAPINLPVTIPLEAFLNREETKSPEKVLPGGTTSEKAASLEPPRQSAPVEEPQFSPALSAPTLTAQKPQSSPLLSAPELSPAKPQPDSSSALAPPVKVDARPSESAGELNIVETDPEPQGNPKEEEREQFVL
jgi:hypothetical protein